MAPPLDRAHGSRQRSEAVRRGSMRSAMTCTCRFAEIAGNAALTYLGALVEGLSDEFKYMLVTGAVTGAASQ